MKPLFLVRSAGECGRRVLFQDLHTDVSAEYLMKIRTFAPAAATVASTIQIWIAPRACVRASSPCCDRVSFVSFGGPPFCVPYSPPSNTALSACCPSRVLYNLLDTNHPGAGGSRLEMQAAGARPGAGGGGGRKKNQILTQTIFPERRPKTYKLKKGQVCCARVCRNSVP